MNLERFPSKSADGCGFYLGNYQFFWDQNTDRRHMNEIFLSTK